MLIVFSNCEEVIVCEKDNEGDVLQDWFGADTGRNLDVYDREESAEVVQIVSTLRTKVTV